MSRQTLIEALSEITAFVHTLDLSQPAAARAALEARFPAASLGALKALFQRGVDEGWLCDKENEGVRFCRVSKDLGGWSLDAVRMSGPGPGHTHPNGEVDLCFAVEGEARFDGNPEGWTVYAPGSWHVPTVSGGLMNILYFLPGGAIRFEPRPA